MLKRLRLVAVVSVMVACLVPLVVGDDGNRGSTAKALSGRPPVKAFSRQGSKQRMVESYARQAEQVQRQLDFAKQNAGNSERGGYILNKDYLAARQAELDAINAVIKAIESEDNSAYEVTRNNLGKAMSASRMTGERVKALDAAKRYSSDSVKTLPTMSYRSRSRSVDLSRVDPKLRSRWDDERAETARAFERVAMLATPDQSPMNQDFRRAQSDAAAAVGRVQLLEQEMSFAVIEKQVEDAIKQAGMTPDLESKLSALRATHARILESQRTIAKAKAELGNAESERNLLSDDFRGLIMSVEREKLRSKLERERSKQRHPPARQPETKPRKKLD